MQLVVENLSVSYGKIKALHGISFSVKEGEIVTIIGANGAGKSTTLRAISRMVPSGPFLVVNLVTGMVGFHPSQFLIGSAIGLLPGIIAFSFFGDIIRSLFTDPSLASTAWFVLFVVGYSAVAKLILTLVRRISGWVRDTSE